jgi:hypothetical protein
MANFFHQILHSVQHALHGVQHAIPSPITEMRIFTLFWLGADLPSDIDLLDLMCYHNT